MPVSCAYTILMTDQRFRLWMSNADVVMLFDIVAVSFIGENWNTKRKPPT